MADQQTIPKFYTYLNNTGLADELVRTLVDKDLLFLLSSSGQSTWFI